MTNIENTTQPNWRPRVSDWVLFGVLLLLTLLDGFVYIMYERNFYIESVPSFYISNYGWLIGVWTILSHSVTILFYVLLLIALFKMKRNAYLVGKKNAAALLNVSFIIMLIVAILSILRRVFETTLLPKLVPEILSYDTYATYIMVYNIICLLLRITGVLLLSIGITKNNAIILKRIAWVYLGLIVVNIIWGIFSWSISSSMEYRYLIIPVIGTIITLVLNTLVGLLFVYRRESIRAKDEEEILQLLE